MLYSVTAIDSKGNDVRLTRDSLKKAKSAARMLHDTKHIQVTVWNGQPGGVRLETLEDPIPEADTLEDSSLPKSLNHICFFGDYEFYEGNDGNVYRASIENAFDGCFRIGRWECSRAHFERFRQVIAG